MMLLVASGTQNTALVNDERIYLDRLTVGTVRKMHQLQTATEEVNNTYNGTS